MVNAHFIVMGLIMAAKPTTPILLQLRRARECEAS